MKYQQTAKVVKELLDDLELGTTITIKTRSGSFVIIDKNSKVGKKALKHCLETILEAC
jgi:hypothetical protein